MRILGVWMAWIALVWGGDSRTKIDHIVVIYLENRSFDALFRGFEGADTSDHPLSPYLPQSDVRGVIYPTLPMGPHSIAQSLPASIPNAPFDLAPYLGPRGLMPDLIHRFYQNQLQIHGGLNDRFVAWSDELGLSMSYHVYPESALWRYAKEYTLCDRFFMGAFGGSFLNHQWLISAQVPHAGEESNLSRAIIDDHGTLVRDGILTPDGYAVNTISPAYPPYHPRSGRLAPLHHETIGDRLTRSGVSWKWYSGDYDRAMRGEGEALNYQYHHNPFVYFAQYAPTSAGRAHLRDEEEFYRDVRAKNLPSVLFIKPSAPQNAHPGYATLAAADEKVEQIVEAIRAQPSVWKKTVIIVTYDENGGLWDHVAPPKGDRWGPGTRIPAIIISPLARKGFVDHTTYDTTSILRLIEWRYRLAPLGTRPANNLLNALRL